MLITSLGVVAFAAAIAAVWPTRFGGSAVFVVVRGESMEPTYHTGDLLYARASDDIGVGDIAVYETPAPDDTTSLVVHRIVAEYDDGTFGFQGDNRDSPDHHRPGRNEIVATPVANLGPFPTQLLIRLPFLLALVAAGTVTWALWPRSDEFDADDPTEAASTSADPTSIDAGDGGASLGERVSVTSSASSLAERLVAYHS
ncbi:MAG: S24/S26 family peptidase [Acidimicrobiales bacterium]